MSGLRVATSESAVAYRFGSFRLEPQAGLLLRGNKPVPLTPKAFSTLLYLVERDGRLVTKGELMNALWPDAFVAEANITQTIFVLRKALSEDGDGESYITNVPGRGYRFDTEVQRIPRNGDERRATESPSSPQENEPVARELYRPAGEATEEKRVKRKPVHTIWKVVAVLTTLLAIASGTLRLWRYSHPTPPKQTGLRTMLAVLPFENLTGDPGQDYFSDGMTEEILTRLGNLDPLHLGIIARTSVMHYKGSGTPLGQIGRELGVQYVIEGSVRSDGERVRISAQLIRVKDQTHLWARGYDRELNGLLALQAEVAHEIADEIELTLDDKRTATEPAAIPRNNLAYDLYLKGQFRFNKRTVLDLEGAIRYFEQAVAEDPTYARAYAGIADSYALMSGYTMRPQPQFIVKARAAALKALECDPRLPEAHTALALIVQNYDWDWQSAEKEFQRAIALDPNYATAHHWYAEHLMWRGRFNEALAESERARQLDPLSLIIATDNGAILYFARRYDQAIAKWRSVLDIDPDFPRAHLIRNAYVERGMFADALADANSRGKKVNKPWHWSALAAIYGFAGDKIESRRALDELMQLNRHEPVDPQVIADAYAGFGDKEQALDWLQKAYEQHSNELVSVGVNPFYDSLRTDPRFEDLVRRVGLGK